MFYTRLTFPMLVGGGFLKIQVNMITIARFQVAEDAYLFRAFLDSKGIPSHVFDEHIVQLAWHYSNAIGGVRVVVDKELASEAYDEYREYIGKLQAEPNTVTVARAWPLVLAFSAICGVPALLFGRHRVKRTPVSRRE